MTQETTSVEQMDSNVAHIYRDQIIGAARAGDDERVEYWLARYADLIRQHP